MFIVGSWSCQEAECIAPMNKALKIRLSFCLSFSVNSIHLTCFWYILASVQIHDTYTYQRRGVGSCFDLEFEAAKAFDYISLQLSRWPVRILMHLLSASRKVYRYSYKALPLPSSKLSTHLLVSGRGMTPLLLNIICVQIAEPCKRKQEANILLTSSKHLPYVLPKILAMANFENFASFDRAFDQQALIIRIWNREANQAVYTKP